MNLITIIIPSYNRGSLINETIKSILAQSCKNWELIIVDDGSTDDTEEVVQPFLRDSRIKYTTRPVTRPGGGNAARNYGYELATGNYVKWLDSDDLLHPQCLEKQLEVISRDNSDVVFCRSRFFEQNGESDKIEGAYWHPTFPTEGNPLENFILGKIRFSNNDGLWRKSKLGKKPYHEDLRNSQEFLMIIKALASKMKVSLLDEVLVSIRSHGERMGSKRSYAIFAKNQCFARYQVIKELKANNIVSPAIYHYLNKSIIHYITMQVKKKEISTLFYGISYSAKSIFFSYLK